MSATTVPTDRPVTANWQKCKNPLDESVATACNNFVASLPTTINFKDKTAAKAWIKKEWHNNRGHDIVTNKHVDLANLWRSVTQNWPALGEDFAKSIIAILSDGHENLSCEVESVNRSSSSTR